MKFRIFIAGASLIALAGAAPSATAQTAAPGAGSTSDRAQDRTTDPQDLQPGTDQHGDRHGQAGPDQAQTGPQPNQRPNSAGAPAKPTPEYIAEAARGDMYEIRSSELAVRKAQSPAVKQFAQQMIRDHNDTSAKLKKTLADARIAAAPPSQLDARRQAMIDTLNGQSGAAFDKAYLEQQTAAHQEALALHSGYAASGENAALKALATATEPRIQHHYDMVKQIASGRASQAAK
jgi:putative membrane protein